MARDGHDSLAKHQLPKPQRRKRVQKANVCAGRAQVCRGGRNIFLPWAWELKTFAPRLQGRCGPRPARRWPETDLAALLSINSLSRNGANEPKNMMLTLKRENDPRPARC